LKKFDSKQWWQETKADPEKLAEHYRKQKEWKDANKDRVGASWKKSKQESPEKWLLKQAKTRAKLKGHEFNLVLEDIKIPLRCPIMNEVLEWIPDGFNPYAPSIDRIDSSKGYTKDNIQVISAIANRMKWNATKEQLLTFCKGVLALEKESQAAC